MMQILQILTSKGLLEAVEAEKVAREVNAGAQLEDALLERGISGDVVLEAKGEVWGVPVRQAGDVAISFDTLKLIPEDSARHYKVVPIGLQDGVLSVGMLDPDNVDALDALNFISTKEGLPFKVYLISREDYEKVLGMYHGVSGTVSMALSELESTEDVTSMRTIGDSSQTQELDDLDATIEAASKKGGIDLHDEAPITKIVSTILRSAIDSRASDIHIEPFRDQVQVRFRVDGVLQRSLVLPAKVSRAVVARVKVLSGIKLDERRKPQDGRFSVTVSGRNVDFRVSTFPTSYGEKAVLRILDSDKGTVTLRDLGMDEEQMGIVKQALNSPYGIILITGPTGSGKSTTLYSMLNEVPRDKKNVLSLEDPVEYDIEGVSQSQVRPEIGYTFASGIRSVLRQDPDIIMVGEIRDKETAQLAVQAALTGHLVLSTLHTNNAIGAVPRLIDMGVDPFLLAPTLRLVIAQRLVRRICDGTGKSIQITGALAKRIETMFAEVPEKYRSRIPQVDMLLGIEPTSTCPAGTRGRVGVFEMLVMYDDVRDAVLGHQSEQHIEELARQHGMFTLQEDAVVKAMHKLIPYEEIATVGVSLAVNEAPETEASLSDLQAQDDTSIVSKTDVVEGGHDLV